MDFTGSPPFVVDEAIILAPQPGSIKAVSSWQTRLSGTVLRSHVLKIATLLLAFFPCIAFAEQAVVRQVIDGDTIYACGSGCYTVRILNIDAPEMPPKSQCEKEAKMAVDARSRLARTIEGRTVELVREGREQDRYGRLLARVLYQGRDMGEMLIAAGVARKWSGRREPWC